MPEHWTPDAEYAEGDVVFLLGEEFRCVAAHRSKVFGNEFYDRRVWKQNVPEAKPGRYDGAWRKTSAEPA